jgi:histidine ammonia-lyase
MKTLEINTGMNGLSFWKEIYEMPVQLSLSADAKDAIKQSHNVISEIIASGDAAHGINTGFGSMADTSIPPDQLATLISNLVLSHTVGSGTPLSQSETRLVMALKNRLSGSGVFRRAPRVGRFDNRNGKCRYPACHSVKGIGWPLG